MMMMMMIVWQIVISNSLENQNLKFKQVVRECRYPLPTRRGRQRNYRHHHPAARCN